MNEKSEVCRKSKRNKNGKPSDWNFIVDSWLNSRVVEFANFFTPEIDPCAFIPDRQGKENPIFMIGVHQVLASQFYFHFYLVSRENKLDSVSLETLLAWQAIDWLRSRINYFAPSIVRVGSRWHRIKKPYIYAYETRWLVHCRRTWQTCALLNVPKDIEVNVSIGCLFSLRGMRMI